MNTAGQPRNLEEPGNSRSSGAPDQDSGGAVFSRIVDEACGRLIAKKAELSIKKIRELERILAEFERGLDELLNGRVCNDAKSSNP